MPNQIRIPKLLLLAAILTFASSDTLFMAHAVEESQLLARLDKNRAEVNEEIHLNIKVEGVQSGIQAPVLPAITGFDIFYSGRSSRFSFVNGRSESLTEFNYVLIPKNAGKYVIEPIEVKWNGETHRTEPLSIEILASNQLSNQPMPQSAGAWSTVPQRQASQVPNRAYGSSPNVPPQTNSPTSLPEGLDENIFLRARPSKLSVFTNEQLILDYVILTRYDTRYEGFEEEPQTSGFWIEEFPLDYQSIGKENEVVNGKQYVKAEIKKIALFPTAPGQYVIQPGRVKTSVQIQERQNSIFNEFFNDSFFSGAGLFARRVAKILTTQPISVQVKALPEVGKPQSFKGAVGEFRMSTQVDKRVVEQNEAVTLKVVLEGRGNIETLSLPALPELKNTKIYESDSSSQMYKEADAIAGNKSFEVILIPSEVGEFVVPSVEFSFFNPHTEHYVILKSDLYKIQVKPSTHVQAAGPEKFVSGMPVPEPAKKSVQVESEDIYFIKEQEETSFMSSKKIFLAMLGLDGILSLLILVLFGMQRREDYFETNQPLKRALAAGKTMQKGMQTLSHLAKKTSGSVSADEANSYFNRCARLLDEYLGSKLNLSPHGMTHSDVEYRLRELEVPDEIIRKIHECYDACDEIRFGRTARIHEKQAAMIEHLKLIFKSLEHNEQLKNKVSKK